MSARDGKVDMLDSIVAAQADSPSCGAHIVLWDGYNSLLELHSKRPQLASRSDIVYLCVGMVPEVVAALPASTLPLFDPASSDPGDLVSRHYVVLPFAYDIQRALRTRVRMLRNRWISSDRHRMLCKGGLLVFCGLVRPSKNVLSGFLRGTKISPNWVQRSGLIDLEWLGQSGSVCRTLTKATSELIHELRRIESPTPADWACAYTLMNVMHRLGTLSLISDWTPSLFVNEFSQDKHLDPYDAAGYRNNVFLDFGSVRGPDRLYPRTVDMALNHKPTLALRWLPENEGVSGRCLQDDTPGWLWERCEIDAGRSLSALQQLFNPER
ncbi:hypothetical protein [Aquabacterium olei]|uniref:hypothetical protein n=1 Tax=Aquabacterium olei TaxID=1296669 RepID=UPI00131EEDC4|nr:hypothetical protein [Aquabacterium olei]